MTNFAERKRLPGERACVKSAGGMDQGRVGRTCQYADMGGTSTVALPYVDARLVRLREPLLHGRQDAQGVGEFFDHLGKDRAFRGGHPL